jgi:hypothetical protein
VGGVERGRLGGVDDRPAADRNEAVEPTLAGEAGGLQEGVVGGLDVDPIEFD